MSRDMSCQHGFPPWQPCLMCGEVRMPIVIGPGPRDDPRDAALASLRAENARLQADLSDWQTTSAVASAEVERLGAAVAGAEAREQWAFNKLAKAESDLAALKARPVGVPAEVRRTIVDVLTTRTMFASCAPQSLVDEALAWLASTADVATSERDFKRGILRGVEIAKEHAEARYPTRHEDFV